MFWPMPWLIIKYLLKRWRNADRSTLKSILETKKQYLHFLLVSVLVMLVLPYVVSFNGINLHSMIISSLRLVLRVFLLLVFKLKGFTSHTLINWLLKDMRSNKLLLHHCQRLGRLKSAHKDVEHCYIRLTRRACTPVGLFVFFTINWAVFFLF